MTTDPEDPASRAKLSKAYRRVDEQAAALLAEIDQELERLDEDCQSALDAMNGRAPLTPELVGRLYVWTDTRLRRLLTERRADLVRQQDAPPP